MSRSDLAAQKTVSAFQATTLDGKTVNFPGDYKGKVVLLDFWATWCPPCRAELPNVVKVYRQYHSQGFEILSVSLDDAHDGAKLTQFVQAQGMAWPQIYDGKYWDAAIVRQYGVQAIPCPVLVDGDTGKVIATDDDALGPNLEKHLQAALAAKAKK